MTYQLVNMRKVHPTEQFLCKTTLDYLEDGRKTKEPIEIFEDTDGEQYLMDGHNRAYVEWKRGKLLQPAEVRTQRETSAFAVAAFVLPDAQKCLQLGITTLDDLEERMVTTREEVRQKSI